MRSLTCRENRCIAGWDGFDDFVFEPTMRAHRRAPSNHGVACYKFWRWLRKKYKPVIRKHMDHKRPNRVLDSTTALLFEPPPKARTAFGRSYSKMLLGYLHLCPHLKSSWPRQIALWWLFSAQRGRAFWCPARCFWTPWLMWLGSRGCSCSWARLRSAQWFHR